MKPFRDIRVIPVVLVAIFCLTVLKVAGLVLDGGYVFDYQPNATQPSWAQQTFNFPGGKVDAADVTGSVDEKPKEGGKTEGGAAKKEDGGKKDEAAKPAAEAAKPEGVVIYPDQSPSVSPSERAILERLQSRRQELEARAREIDIRESLLKAAEKRMESRAEELKAVEARVATTTEHKGESDAVRLKNLVSMYEGMKPKDAAKVFDRLEMSVLFELATQIAPRKMSDILGLMSPEVAEHLTVEMARRAGSDKATSTDDLPKIEGKIIPQTSN